MRSRREAEPAAPSAAPVKIAPKIKEDAPCTKLLAISGRTADTNDHDAGETAYGASGWRPQRCFPTPPKSRGWRTTPDWSCVIRGKRGKPVCSYLQYRTMPRNLQRQGPNGRLNTPVQSLWRSRHMNPAFRNVYSVVVDRQRIAYSLQTMSAQFQALNPEFSHYKPGF